MKESIKDIIYHYKIYLNKKIKENRIDINNFSDRNIKKLEENTKKELELLKYLSQKYKLYDENYNNFMLSMGNLALAIESINEINMDFNYKKSIIKEFENMHSDFEELEQINIMKDIYVWKFISEKENYND